jgi:hypothetical protein
MRALPLFPIVNLSVRSRFYERKLSPCRAAAAAPGVKLINLAVPIFLSAAASKGVAGRCCCMKRCVPCKRVWLHFFALLFVMT